MVYAMTFEVSRRTLLGLIGLGSASLLTACGSDPSTPHTEQPAPATKQPPKAAASEVPPALLTVTVFKDPSCGCCDGWIKHVQENGLSVAVEHPDVLEDVFADHDIPVDLQSCHLTRNTAGTIFVGHVPVRFVLEYLADPTEGSRGLAVPAMPAGTPGMEMDDQFDPYEVLLLNEDGSASVFAKVETSSDQSI